MDGRRFAVAWCVLGASVLGAEGCRQRAEPAPVLKTQVAGAPAADVAAAVDRSARYLAGLCDERGQFTYRSHLDPTVEVDAAYNELRHAGAVYALAQYCQRSPNDAALEAMQRAARFLRQELLQPVPDNDRLRAAWLPPGLAGQDEPRQAKLGGTGLALIALLSVEQVAPGSTSLEDLRGLGRFLIFMQKPDGTFYTRYFPDRGRSDARQSDYYPGEAALGLLLLSARDPTPQWLHTAAKALAGITQRGAARDSTFPDQWFLLAAERMMRLPPDDALPLSRAAVLTHARQICQDMLRDQTAQRDSSIPGCFTADGRSCPTATRLEGLLAALHFLPDSAELSHAEIRRAIDEGMRFLLRCQIPTGPHAGAFPRVLHGFTPPAGASDHERADEIRIDYVQHALSAMMQFEAEFPKN
jgi:hypothetical protein